MTVLIPLLCFAAFCLCWPVFAEDAPTIVPPLSPDDEALREHYRAVERNKVETLRRQSEAIRRHYIGITLPAMRDEVWRRRYLRAG